MPELVPAEPYLIDTNVLVYAYDVTAAAKHAKALAFMEANQDNPFAFVALQNLGEFAAVALKKKGGLKGANVASIVSDLRTRFNQLHYTDETMVAAARLAEKYRAPFWDTLLAQTMREHGLALIVTENERDFRRLPGLRVLDPFRD